MTWCCWQSQVNARAFCEPLWQIYVRLVQQGQAFWTVCCPAKTRLTCLQCLLNHLMWFHCPHSNLLPTCPRFFSCLYLQSFWVVYCPLIMEPSSSGFATWPFWGNETLCLDSDILSPPSYVAKYPSRFAAKLRGVLFNRQAIPRSFGREPWYFSALCICSISFSPTRQTLSAPHWVNIW